MDKQNNVSKETIYTYIYVSCKGKLKKKIKRNPFFCKNRKFLIYEVFQNAIKKIVPYLGRRFNYGK